MERLITNRINRSIFAGLLSFAGTCSFDFLFMGQENRIDFSNSIFSVFLFGLLFAAFQKVLLTDVLSDRRKRITGFFTACAFSMAMHFGRMLETQAYIEFLNVSLWLSVFAMTFTLTPFVLLLWDCLQKLYDCSHIFENEKKSEDIKNSKSGKSAESDKSAESNKSIECDRDAKNPKAVADIKSTGSVKQFLIYCGIIFLLWLPVFLALFPGAFVYDAQEEYVEVASHCFTTHHPLLHVLLLGGSVRLFEHFFQSANAGIAFYTICQMLVVSAAFSYFLCFLKQLKFNGKIRTGILLFVGLVPIFPMYAVCSAKDTLFTTGFLMILIFLVQFFMDKKSFFAKKRRVIFFILVSALTMMLRNNGMYAYAAFIVCFLLFTLFCKKKDEKKLQYKLAGCMAGSILLSLLCLAGLAGVLHAESHEHQEMLTVPIQQLARTYAYAPESFTEEERQTLFEILPENMLKTYTPRLSDIVKSGFDNEAYEKNPSTFYKLWINMGLKNPLIYLNAWFLTSYGYWYPDAMINVYGGHQMYTYQYGDSSYFGFETEPPGERISLLPPLETFYKNLSLTIYQQKVPVLSMLFSPGFMFWIFFTIMMYFLAYRKLQCFMVGLPVFWLCMTVLLGPTYLVRYVLILWYFLPVLLLLPYIVKAGKMCYTTQDYRIREKTAQ